MNRPITALLILLLSLWQCNAYAQTKTVGLVIHNAGTEDDGYVLFAPQKGDTTYLIDKCGRLVHQWGSAYKPGLDAYILPDGSLLRTGDYPNAVFGVSLGSAGGIIERFDWDGNLQWHYVISNLEETQNHDIWPMPNGNILVAVWEVITKTQALAQGRNPAYVGASGLWSAKVEEIKPIGADSAEVVWSWRLWDHLVQDHDASKPNFGIVVSHPELYDLNYIDTSVTALTAADFIHLNSVTYNPDLDQVMISAHNTSELWVIDHSTTTAEAATHSGGVHNKGGDFLYRWGNAAVYRRGTGADQKLFEQHDPEWITQGKYKGQIMVFNNGMGRGTTSANDYTSVDILKPPVDTAGNYTIGAGAAYGPDTLSWTYTASPLTAFNCGIMGGAQVLENGNVLICHAVKGFFLEVDSVKNTVWRYINPICNGTPIEQGFVPSGNSVYRCTFYPSSYAGFAGHGVGPGTAPLEINPLPSTCVLDVTPVSDDEALNIYPNPVSDAVHVEAKDITSVSIMDITGRVICREAYHNAHIAELNVSRLQAGIYIVCVNGVLYRRIQVSR